MYTSLLLPLTLIAFLATAQSHAETCVPNYQPMYDACKASDKLAPSPVSITSPEYEGFHDDDDFNKNKICEEHKREIMAKYPELRVQDIGFEAHQSKDGIKMWGPMFKMRSQVNVVCDYSFVAEVPVMVPDPSCEVNGAEDVNGCYSHNSPVDISVASINSCLDIRPKTIAEAWIQSTCLVDAFKAQNNQMLVTDLPLETYNRIQVRLQSIQNRPNSARRIVEFIQSSKR